MLQNSFEEKVNRTYIYTIAILIVCTIGITLRLFIIQHAGWKIDYDEAMIGLLTRRVLSGELVAFVPGQPTLGSIEAYLLTPLFTLFGDNIYTFRSYSILVNVGYIASCMYLGRMVGDKYTALLAGLFAAVAPAYMIVTGLKTWGATIETIVAGNMLFIGIAKTIDSNSKKWALVSGITGGILFWNSPLSVYYLLPAGFIALYHYRKTVPLTLYSIGGFFFGSLPLWIHNILNDFETFRVILDESSVRGVSRLDTLIDILTRQYPKIITGYEAWLTPNPLLLVIAAVTYSLGLIFLIYKAIAKKNKVALLLTTMLMIIPLIYTQSGYGAAAFNAYSVDATGRYLLMLHSALPIGVAILIRSLPKYLGLPIGIILLITNIAGIALTNSAWAFDSPYYNRQPDNILEITEYLTENEYLYVWTDVGIAQPLMMYSSGEIHAADYHDYYHGGIQRFPEIFDRVYMAENPIFLVPIIPGQTDTPIARELDANNIEYEVIYMDKIAIYIPRERISPETVIDGLGLQY